MLNITSKNIIMKNKKYIYLSLLLLINSCTINNFNTTPSDNNIDKINSSSSTIKFTGQPANISDNLVAKPNENLDPNKLISKPGENIDPKKMTIIKDKGKADLLFNYGDFDLTIKIKLTEFSIKSISNIMTSAEYFYISLVIDKEINIFTIDKELFEEQNEFTLKLKGLSETNNIKLNISVRNKNSISLLEKEIIQEKRSENTVIDTKLAYTNDGLPLVYNPTSSIIITSSPTPTNYKSTDNNPVSNSDNKTDVINVPVSPSPTIISIPASPNPTPSTPTISPTPTSSPTSTNSNSSLNITTILSKNLQGLNMNFSDNVVDTNNSNIIINQCGNKAIITNRNVTGNNYLNRILANSNSGNEAIKIDNSITSAKIYNTLFKSSSGIINYNIMKEKVRDSVIKQAEQNNSSCSFVPLKIANRENISRNTNNTNCNMNGNIIDCNDADRTPQQVKIDLSQCSKVVLYANSISLKTMPVNNPTIIANATGNFDIQGSVSGFFSSETNMNLHNQSGQETNGIFILNSSNINVGGKLNGMLFATNQNGEANTNINISTISKISGALVVDGSINSLSNSGRLEFNFNEINRWSNVISGLFNQFTCEDN